MFDGPSFVLSGTRIGVCLGVVSGPDRGEAVAVGRFCGVAGGDCVIRASEAREAVADAAEDWVCGELQIQQVLCCQADEMKHSRCRTGCTPFVSRQLGPFHNLAELAYKL